jgi:hypothetical protein
LYKRNLLYDATYEITLICTMYLDLNWWVTVWFVELVCKFPQFMAQSKGVNIFTVQLICDGCIKLTDSNNDKLDRIL